MTDPEATARIRSSTTTSGRCPCPWGMGRPCPWRASVATPSPMGAKAISTGGVFRQMGRVFVENKLAVVGVGVIVLMVLFCFVGPHLYSTNQTNAQEALLELQRQPPPGNGNPSEPTATGFDMLGRLMFGGQVSLIVGFASALVATVFGTIYGATSGFFGNWLDSILMRVVDVLLSIPVLFLLIALVTIYHQSEAALSWSSPSSAG